MKKLGSVLGHKGVAGAYASSGAKRQAASAGVKKTVGRHVKGTRVKATRAKAAGLARTR